MPIKMKRSAVAGKVPTTEQLDLGELAVNTGDGTIYLKTDDGAGGVAVQEFRNWADLSTALAAASHSHAIGDVTGLQTALDGKAASGHGHAIGEVTGLQTALDGKASLTGTETLTNKTMSAVTLEDGLAVETQNHDIAGTQSLDPANGLVQGILLTGDVTYTDGLAAGESIVLHINDGSARTITWPMMTWVSGDGAPPVLKTSGDTVITVWKLGSTVYGFASNGA